MRDTVGFLSLPLYLPISPDATARPSNGKRYEIHAFPFPFDDPATVYSVREQGG
jgi:hypothetical protein